MGDRFERLELLGEGGFGAVHRARDRELGREVALKILKPEARAEPEAFARFAREARAQAGIESPHVVRIYAVDLEAEEPWIAMELVKGRDLEGHVKRHGPRDAPELDRLARQLSAGIDELHSVGVVHRDLKPANVMIREPGGEAVLMDLGLASVVDATVLTRTGQIMGSPAYIPPEVLKGGEWTARGDVYQVGAILFEAAAGVRLVPGRTLNEVLTNASAGTQAAFPTWIDLPEVLVRAILGAASPDPATRLETGAAIVDVLEGRRSPILGTRRGEATAPGLPSAGAATGRFSFLDLPSRRPWARWVAGLAGVLLVILGATWGGGGAPDPAPLPPGPRPVASTPDGPEGLRAVDLPALRGQLAELEALELDPDPYAFPGEVASVPALARLHRLAAEGGELGALPGPVREALEAIDSRFEAAGLAAPADPLLQVLPEDAAPFAPGDLPGGLPGNPPGEVRGWAAVALRELLTALELLGPLEARFAREGPGLFGGAARTMQFGALVGNDRLRDFLREGCDSIACRREAARVLGEAAASRDRGLVAAGRALVEDHPGAAWLGLAVAELAERLRGLETTGWTTLDLAVRLGGPVRSDAVTPLWAAVGHRTFEHLEASGGDGMAVVDPLMAAIRRGAAAAGEGEVVERLRRECLNLGIQMAMNLRDGERLGELLVENWGFVQAHPGRLWVDSYMNVLTHYVAGAPPPDAPAGFLSVLAAGARVVVASDPESRKHQGLAAILRRFREAHPE